MKINLFNTYFNNTQRQQRSAFAGYSNLAPLPKDVVSFGSMKKTQFEGIDFAVVGKFKAPIEKFKTNNDLQNWCYDKIKTDILDKDFGGRQPETIEQRKHMLNEWSNYVLNENKAYTNSIALLILSAITKDLKPNNDKLPPVLNKGVLADCVAEVDKNLRANKKYNFDFNKIYNTKLAALYLEDTNTGENGAKWVKIPSKAHDPENFEANVEKLKALSHKNWCTKTFNAEPYLKDGDFHVYIEDGKPKLGVSFIGDTLHEIQGEANNNKLPAGYLDVMKAYIAENNFELEYSAQEEIKDAEKIQETVLKIADELKDAIKNNDVKAILGRFGINATADKDGYYTISNYKQPSDDYNFSDIGIDEQRMFSKIKKITGSANFENSAVSNFTTLKEIGGDAVFTYSKITDLGSLETIGRDAKFNDSNVKNLGSLQEIGRNLVLGNAEIEDLNNLEYIGNNVDFGGTELKSLGNLETIGGNAKFSYSKLKDLGKLTSIGYVADFSNSEITSLGNLESIGSDAIFEKSKVKDLGNLKEIGGDAYIGDSELTPEDFEKVDLEYAASSYDEDDYDLYFDELEKCEIVRGRIIEDVDEYYD